MTQAHKSERLQIILTLEELVALDDWRYANRLPTRAAAVRELMRRGIEVRVDAEGTMTFKRSRDFRLVKGGSDGATLFAGD